MRRSIFAVLVGIQFISAGPAALALGAQTRSPSQVRPTEGEVTAAEEAVALCPVAALRLLRVGVG